MKHNDLLKPISSRTTVADGVYQQMREALSTGQFDPGQVMTIATLSKTFQTSHMPVREALRRLGAERALEIASNGSAHVPQVSEERLDDINRARVALEGLATELAAQNVKDEDMDHIEACLQEHLAASKQGDVYGMLLKNRNFHFAVYNASRSEVLVQLIDLLWLRYGPYMRMLSAHVAPRVEAGLHEPYSNRHQAIIKALRNRDGEAARQHMVTDIMGTSALLRELCRNHR